MINVVLKHHCGSDLTTVNSARVSFAKESLALSPKDEGLIHYLAEHEHISPFGHAFATFKVDAPVFVARQPDIYSPDLWRTRPENKKQGSGPAFEREHQNFLQQQYVEIMDRVLHMYEYMKAYGVAPEQARMLLPQSMMTSWWWSGSLDAFAKMCKLRLGPDAQTETREVAIQIAEYMTDLFPVSWKALMENT
jgi:thymidylate synthase (FAD)